MKVCKSYFSKVRGLIFSKKRNLFFVFSSEKRRSLHMWFVFFPIDVLFLDKQRKIIEIKMDFKPFTLYRSQKKAQYVVELVFPHKYKIGERFK